MNADTIYQKLCANAEGKFAGEWCDVYLDNARPNSVSEKSFRSFLAVLSKRGVYKPIDGYAWGAVLMP